LPNFTCASKYCRSSGLGGGVAIYYNNNSLIEFFVTCSDKKYARNVCDVNCIELSIVNIKLVNRLDQRKTLKFVLICLYRSPKNKEHEFIDSFESLLYNVFRDNEHVIICGDWNINFLDSIDPNVVKLRDLFLSFNLKEFVENATRVSEHSKSLLDNVVTNFDSEIISCNSYFNILSDHECQVIAIDFCAKPVKSSSKKRIFSDYNIGMFINELSQVDWSFLQSRVGVNNKFKSFSYTVQTLFNRAFPLKSVRGKEGRKGQGKLSRELKAFADRNVDLGILVRDFKDPALKALLKERQKLFRKLVLEEKRAAISRQVGSSDCVQRVIWNVVRKETQGPKQSNSLPPLKSSGDKVHSPHEIATIFNNYFSTVSYSDAPSLSPSRLPVGGRSPVQSLFLAPVTLSELKETILSLKSKKSTGIDEISSTLLKAIYPSILDPLVYLINTSMSSGVFPDIYKIARVIPIFKSGDKSDVNNYRPISLLCTISKVIEKVIYSRLVNHLDKHKILIPNQYGFRSNRSTIHAIVDFISDAVCKLDQRQPALGIFCDLSKAFDRVNHEILCNKLEAYGVRGVALSWFRSYLSNRVQFVEIAGTQSGHVGCKYGVPQGSILGPLLFIIYINDLAVHLPLAKTIFYADDTSMLFGGPHLDLQTKVDESLHNLKRWLSENNLLLNSKKSGFMQFLTTNKDAFDVSLDEFGLEECSSVKFLGVTVDNKLSWLPQVTQLCSKLNRINYALRTLSPLLDSRTMLMVYHGCFFSVMAYGIEVWGGSSHASKVFLAQKRAVRIIQGLPPLHSCRGVFKSLNILTLPSMYIFKLIASTVDNFKNIPLVGASHNYPTRHGGALRTPKHRLALSERYASFAGPSFFNRLPVEIKKNSGKVPLFLKSVKKFLIEKECYNLSEFLSD
jgi:hypothetical protein